MHLLVALTCDFNNLHTSFCSFSVSSMWLEERTVSMDGELLEFEQS